MGSTTLIGDLGCTDPPDKYTPNKFTRFYIAARWVDAKKIARLTPTFHFLPQPFLKGAPEGEPSKILCVNLASKCRFQVFKQLVQETKIKDLLIIKQYILTEERGDLAWMANRFQDAC